MVLKCKYGCEGEYPDKPALMRHYKVCPKKPAPIETALPEKQLTEDEVGGELKNLERIISEVSGTRRRPGIVRMVSHVLDDKEKSIRVLSEALRMSGGVDPSQRNLIVRNWASHLEVDDLDEILKKDKKVDAEEEKEDGKKKTPIEKLKEGVKKAYDGELEQLEIMRVRKQIANMERELSGEGKKEEKKLLHIIDGVSLNVTPQEKMAWMKYEDDRKKQEEEREERKVERKQQDEDRRNRESELKTHKADELVEWVIGEGSSAKTVKVRPETIPLLIQSQGKKGGESDELKILREEIKLMREQHQQFQTNVLQKEIEELKVYASRDPLDRIFEQKEKLEKLGLVGTGKLDARDQMLQMDSKKLDTLLGIVTNKSQSTETKVNTLMTTLGPLAQDYVREAILNMKQQRGEIAPEATRTESELDETLESLEEVDKKLSATDQDRSSTPSEPAKVVSIGKTEKKPTETNNKGG